MHRPWLSSIGIALIMLTSAAPPLAAAPLNILWADTHDTDTPPQDELWLEGGYSKFAAAVVAAGHSIYELDGFPGDLTPEALEGYDVLMLFDLELAFWPDEIAATQSFVANGGSVLVTGELPAGFARESHNTLLAPYGLEFTPDTILGGWDLAHFEPDPLTSGLVSIEFAGSGSLNVSGPGTKILGRIVVNGVVGPIGFAYGAAGRVVVLSDSNMFTDTLATPGDNEYRLISNLLAHFMVMAGGEGGDPLEITIDIKPGGVPNSINPKSKGVVPVAILTTNVADGDAIDFDPWDSIDVETLRFGPGEAPLAHAQGIAEDVDGDGDLDMVVHFSTPAIGVSCGDTELTLTAETYEGDMVTGTDSITTPGCP
ncbi:MAG TPA: hypothetical protein VMS86_15750 [Thermoanaerobaculia bacterium]|nr:hypothetical protein [Thermoanaerobaculia bacterium]